MPRRMAGRSRAVLGCDGVEDPERQECGYFGVDEEACAAQGCCWGPLEDNSANLPWCFRPAA